MQFTNRIDRIDDIDLENVTLQDIYWKYGTGISIVTGSKRDRTYSRSYRNGVMTNIGDIQENIWYQVAKHIAQRDNEDWVVNALFAWKEAHNYTKSSRKVLYQKALELYACRIYDNPHWSNYIPFNQTYRPDVLKHAQIISVVNSCCGKLGNVTQQQIDHAYNGKICCPHCGRWSSFTVVDDDSPREK